LVLVETTATLRLKTSAVVPAVPEPVVEALKIGHLGEEVMLGAAERRAPMPTQDKPDLPDSSNTC
jgi:hypothetical protein